MLKDQQTLAGLAREGAGHGEVRWIGVRPGRRQAMVEVDEVQAHRAQGLEGDRYAKDGKRQVTLLQPSTCP